MTTKTIETLANEITAGIETLGPLLLELKNRYVEECKKYRRRVICSVCGKEYERRETDSEYTTDLVKVCTCKADGKIMDAERRN